LSEIFELPEDYPIKFEEMLTNVFIDNIENTYETVADYTEYCDDYCGNSVNDFDKELFKQGYIFAVGEFSNEGSDDMECFMRRNTFNHDGELIKIEMEM